jgi:hypothetical protein
VSFAIEEGLEDIPVATVANMPKTSQNEVGRWVAGCSHCPWISSDDYASEETANVVSSNHELRHRK